MLVRTANATCLDWEENNVFINNFQILKFGPMRFKKNQVTPSSKPIPLGKCRLRSMWAVVESKRKCLKVVLKSVAFKSLVVWSSCFFGSWWGLWFASHEGGVSSCNTENCNCFLLGLPLGLPKPSSVGPAVKSPSPPLCCWYQMFDTLYYQHPEK